MIDDGNLEDRLRAAEWILNHPELNEPKNHAQKYIDFTTSHGHQDVLSKLIAAGIKNTAQLSDDEACLNMVMNTMVRYYCKQGMVNDLIKAIASGSNVNSIDVDSDTPLNIAAAYGQKEIVEILLAVGADPNHVNNDGDTASSIAKKYGQNSIIPILTNL